MKGLEGPCFWNRSWILHGMEFWKEEGHLHTGCYWGRGWGRMGKIVMEGRKERVNHLPEYLLGRATGGGVTGWKVFVGIVGWLKGMDLIEEMCWRVHREGETWIHYKVQQSFWRMEVEWEGGAVAGLATWLQFLFLFALLSLFHWLLVTTQQNQSQTVLKSPLKRKLIQCFSVYL